MYDTLAAIAVIPVTLVVHIGEPVESRQGSDPGGETQGGRGPGEVEGCVHSSF